MLPFVFWVFWRYGVSLIWKIDGWTQYSKALAYYGIWLRDLLNAWVSGDFSIPSFSLSIGYGADIISTLQYYTIGDPLNLLSVFVPVDHVDVLYGVLLVIRFYLAGFSYVLAAWYLLGRRPSGILIGAIGYAFSGWMVYRVAENPFFGLPMILFPLVILGVERVLRERKGGVLLVAVAGSAFANFYFFYMIVLLTLCYVCVRVPSVFRRHGWRETLKRVLVGLLCAIGGVLLASIALVPVLSAFLDSPRATTEVVVPSFYPRSYYVTLFLQFAALSAETGEYAYVYTGPLTLLGAFWALVNTRRRPVLILLTVLCGVLFLLPFAGYALNGFSYVTNRWVWAWAFLASIMATIMWRDVWESSSRSIVTVFGLLAIYTGISAFLLHRGVSPSLGFHVVVGILLAIVILFLMLLGQDRRWRLLAMRSAAGVVAFGLVVTGYWHFRDYRDSFVSSGVWRESIEHSDSAEVAAHSEQSLVRYEYAPGLINGDNTSPLHGVGSTEFYWSIDRSQALRWLENFAVSDILSYYRQGLDARTILGASTGRSFLVTQPNAALPYGFAHIENYRDTRANTDLALSSSTLVLPFGYTYSERLAASSFEGMSPTQREEALLYNVLVDEAPTRDSESSFPILSARAVAYEVNGSQNTSYHDGIIEVSDPGGSINLSFSETLHGEAHVFFRGLTATTTNGPTAPANQFISADFECSTQDAEAVRFRYVTDKWVWFQGRKDFIINSRFCDGGISGVNLRFENAGTQKFDSLEVWYQPLNGFEEAVAELSAEKLENVNFHDIGLSRATSEITGDITVSKPKVLVVTIPKTDGWTAYVDGKKQEILTANIMWMGLELEPGHHDIQLVYRTPGLREGAAISVVTAAGLVVFWLLRRRKARKSQSFEGVIQ